MTFRRLSGLRQLFAICAVLALLAVVAAGCGSSSKAGRAGAAGTDGRAAQAFPASTVAFLDANIDETSPAWKQLLALGQRFPSWPKLAAEFDKAANDATDNGPTLTQLRSWLGSELAIGVLDVPTNVADPTVPGFAEVRDQVSSRLRSQSTRTPARSASTATTTSSAARTTPSSRSRP